MFKEDKIGNTPLVELKNLCDNEILSSQIFAKLEGENPAGSAKDRVALEMINDAERQGFLKKDATIIEPTSGNTGIGLAAICQKRGYKCIIVMPDNMSVERQQLIAKYGAIIILTPGEKGMAGSIKKAEELHKQIIGSFIPAQFDNPANAAAHYKTTGPEIWKQTNGQVDVLVSAIGTGGTITGTGQYLKEQNPNIQVIGVEPATSAVLSGGKAGPHQIQGIGAGFVPKVLNTKIYDQIFPITDEEAFSYAKKVAKYDGVSAGISSGAALCAAVKYAKSSESKLHIVVIFPDDASKYLSIL